MRKILLWAAAFAAAGSMTQAASGPRETNIPAREMRPLMLADAAYRGQYDTVYSDDGEDGDDTSAVLGAILNGLNAFNAQMGANNANVPDYEPPQAPQADPTADRLKQVSGLRAKLATLKHGRQSVENSIRVTSNPSFLARYQSMLANYDREIADTEAQLAAAE